MNTRLKFRKSPVAASCEVGLVLALLGGLSFFASPVAAQESDQGKVLQTWDRLRTVNSRITSCRVTWKNVRRNKPNPQVDPDKWAARVLETARKEGFSEVEAKRQAEDARRDAQKSRQGRTITSLLNFVRVGNVVRCDITNSELGSSAIDFTNGTYSLFAWTRVNNKDTSVDGDLTPDPKEVLSRSAAGEEVARFLLGIPLDEQLSPANPSHSAANASLRTVANGDLLVEWSPDLKALSAGQMYGATTFSKETLLPISFQSFFNSVVVNGDKPSVTKGAPYSNITATQYKQYGKGILFPSVVTVTTPTATKEYTLVKAAFNEAVDPMEVRLPPDMRIADARFGTGSKLASYKPKNGQLPSDAEVKAMLSLDKAADQAKEGNAKVTPMSALPVAPIAGLLFIAMGAVMWTSAHRKEKE